ncbi:hypothetical protein MVEN_01628100 [Mycena venus]|uniref:Uncharacterized protein n=1 Tax=Mycena venus TaxID=2733690 RepID=A0A8H6XNQ9_9AGAR|nr:hypothetical protein MVEN_01628100 [Mycena venus]
MFSSSILVIVPFLAVINAVNDWKVPCTTGQCSYDLPTTNNGSASGTMTIWGAEDAISDITTAADWQILGCDPNALSQDIRLVCTSDDPNSSCSHLYASAGAVNKIVRLPENCGSSAFARIANAWVPEDQSIPASIAKRLVRRDGSTPQVKALTIDTNFDAVDYSKTGPVNIAIQGANVPGAGGTISIPPSRRSTRISQRSLLGFAKKAVKSIASNAINVKKSVNLKPLALTKSISLLNKSIKCGAATASLKADLAANAHATASVGVAASGTLIPPKLTDFGIITGLTASVDGTLDLTADVAGSIDSGKIPLINVGVPGLDFPGILTVGPSFQVNAEFTGSFDVNLDMQVGIVFNVNNAQLAFPPGTAAAPAAKAFSIGDTPLTLSASPEVKATGTVAAHLIPSLNLGISALGGQGQGDGAATTLLTKPAAAKTTKAAAAKATKPATKPAAKTAAKPASKPASKPAAEPASVKTTPVAKPAPVKTTQTPSEAAAVAAKKAAKVSARAVTASFGGCFNVGAELAVRAGADGSFFGLFDKSATKTLFTKNFEIFKKCFGSAAKRSPMLFSRSRLEREANLERRALSCPKAGVKSPVSVTKGTVKAASIKAA